MDDRLEKQAALAAISRHNDEILRCCEESADILDALEELKVLTQKEKDDANERENYDLVVPRLRENIKIDPSFFNRFCHHITQRKELSNLAEVLVGTYSKATLNDESTAASSCDFSPSSPKAECSTTSYTILGSLKKKLSDYKSINPMPSKESIRSTIVDTINVEEKLGADIKQVNDELFKMHQEGIISQEIYEWAISEARPKERPETDQSSVSSCDTLLTQYTPIELDNDDLYHASLCSKVVCEATDAEQCSQLLRSSSCQSVSMTQLEDQGTFPKCIIALFSDDSGSKTCFVAFDDFTFQEILSLSDEHSGSTFGAVFENQIEKFPMLYLEKVVKTVNRVVITGFCFGGVLAQMLAARLWLLPQTNTDHLMSSVVCITFGQPLIQSEQLSHAADIFPDFRNNVYAIGLADDSFLSIIERVDSLASITKEGLPTILRNLSCLQEFHLSQKHEESIMSTQRGHISPPATPAKGAQETLIGNIVPSYIDEAQQQLTTLLHSQLAYSNENSTAQWKLIVKDGSSLKLVEKNESLLENVDFFSQKIFDPHMTDVYHRSIEKLISYCQENKTNTVEISSDFLCPLVEWVKVIQYGNEAVIEVGGQQLWFVHSMKLLSIIKDPVQVKEVSINFKTSMDKIPRDQRESEIVIFSYFYRPVRQKVKVQIEHNRLSPRSKQLAKLEPQVILEFAFTMSLLERCPNRLNCSGSQSGESPFFKFFEKYLRDMALVVPYESILCTVAQCNDKQVVKRCMSTIKQLKAEFPFSLMMYTSLFVHAFKIQHQEQESLGSDFLDQQPFEVCAYFMWSKAKYEIKKGIPSKAAVDSFSKEVFADQFVFRSQDLSNEDFLDLRKMVQDSLQHVNSLLKVEAVSNKSAADLYNMNYCNAGPSSTSEQNAISLKSPIEVLIDGREKLRQSVDEPALKEPISEVLKTIKSIRKTHLHFFIRVLCGFVFPHVQVPFTEMNPMTFWKHLRYKIAPYSDVFKEDTEYWVSFLKRCKSAIAKGSQITKREYNGKLEFLVNNMIDSDSGSEDHTTVTSTEYSMYMLEKKLKEFCSRRKIGNEILIDQMVHEWQEIFKGCRNMMNIASSHRSLVSRWIKWSLMVHELRLMLENHITIAITGLVNSGKTQLIRSLFGFDLKAGTSESHRTIVPFMYTLAPDVEGVHVVDLPGADDNDKTLHRLTDILKSISQVVIFVVRQDKVFSENTQLWLPKFETRGKESDKVDDQNDHIPNNNEDTDVPLLVCMTFADKVLAEVMDEDGKYDKVTAKQEVEEHFQDISRNYFDGQCFWKPKRKRTLGYYCLDLSGSTLHESDMRAVNIGVPSEVGDWICQQLREELHAYDTTKILEAYFKKSCSKLYSYTIQ